VINKWLLEFSLANNLVTQLHAIRQQVTQQLLPEQPDLHQVMITLQRLDPLINELSKLAADESVLEALTELQIWLDQTTRQISDQKNLVAEGIKALNTGKKARHNYSINRE
jgi:hypothetical protein